MVYVCCLSLNVTFVKEKCFLVMYSYPPVSLTLFTLKRNVSVYSLFKTDRLVMGIGNYITIPKTKHLYTAREMFQLFINLKRLDIKIIGFLS